MDTAVMESSFRSERLVYRAIEDNEEDKKFFHEQLMKDPVTFAFSDLRHFRPQSQKDSEEIFKLFPKCMISVVACLPSERDTVDRPTPIGFVFLVGYPSPARFQHRSGSLAIVLAKPYQSKGYGTEAMNWILDWAFIHSNLHSINLKTFSFNTQAIKAYEKVGFVRDGRQRESIWFNRQWHDEFLYSMLESDWEALRGKEKPKLVTRD
jgi:RimJ/RimL family protein N-acetyltransferase